MTRFPFTKTFLLFTCLLLGSTALMAQEKDSPIKKMMQDKKYIFMAQTYSSTSVAIRQLNASEYDVRITADSVIATLPYFGQSYSAQIGGNSSDNSIKFVSTKFDYTAAEKKNGRWEISIKPKDARGISMFLTVYTNSTAMLQVTSSSREAMSFNGYVLPK